MAEVVTGEAVVLDLAVAQPPTRILALLIDLAVQVPALAFADIVVFRAAARHLNPASAIAIAVVSFVLAAVGYPVIVETLSRGKSLGKLALGIRIVSDDGGAVRFRQTLIRALAGAFLEIWLVPLLPIVIFGLPVGLITSLVSERHKRLGDMFAGTFAVTERVPRRPDLPPAFAIVPPPLTGWAQHLELSRLDDQTAAAAGSYLRRYATLNQAARVHLGWRLAGLVAAQTSPAPPAGTPPEAYLAAVLAVRRERELARLSSRRAAPGWQAPPAASVGQPAGPGRQDSPTGPGRQDSAAGRAPGQPAGAFVPPTAAWSPERVMPLPSGAPAASPPGPPAAGPPDRAQVSGPEDQPPADFGFAVPR